jgi:hypothetical protein
VVRNGPQFKDGRLDTLLNPALIIEILSPSTEATIRLETVELDLKLADLYEKVEFAQTPPEMRLHP